MVLAKGSQLLGKCQQYLAVHGILPVQPANLIVLAVRIVVASLGVAALISRKKERCPLRQKIDRHEIAHLTVSERTDVLFKAWRIAYFGDYGGCGIVDGDVVCPEFPTR